MAKMSKIDKARMNVYVATDLKNYVVEQADYYGMTISAYISMLIADKRKSEDVLQQLPGLLGSVDVLREMEKNMDKK